jgi:hypothetical protein
MKRHTRPTARRARIGAAVVEGGRPGLCHTQGAGRRDSSAREGRARMIGSAVMFVGAGILMGNREDVLVIVGMALGLLALVAFAVEYRRSWHRDDG